MGRSVGLVSQEGGHIVLILVDFQLRQAITPTPAQELLAIHTPLLLIAGHLGRLIDPGLHRLLLGCRRWPLLRRGGGRATNGARGRAHLNWPLT